MKSEYAKFIDKENEWLTVTPKINEKEKKTGKT